MPLDEAKQKYNFMNADLKKTLKRRILDKSHLFNLDNILISSYTYQASDSLQLSALDMAHAVSSLLEAPY